MRVLFVHQNMPGQFEHMARSLGASGHNQVVFLTCREDREIPGVRRITYARPQKIVALGKDAPPDLSTQHHFMRYGLEVGRACVELRKRGFKPDVIIAHPGWGEAMFLKDVFPDVPFVNYCEFYYRAFGSDRDFYPGEGQTWSGVFSTRISNTHLLHSLAACDVGLSPTEWQKAQHPEGYKDKIRVIHDGIDTSAFRPSSSAEFRLPNGRVLTRDDEVVTYGVRNLERYRGFDMFMRAIPEICRRNPNAQVVIAGGDQESYGKPPKPGSTWREAMLEEVEIDPARVHFVGWLPIDQLVAMLQVSSAHVYLTVPFVLSWSMMMALSTGCVVCASSTPPVTEVVEHGKNGFLFDYFSPRQLASCVSEALTHAKDLEHIRMNARETVLDRYALDICLPQQLALLERIGRKSVMAA